jgi:3'-phosphoadenosine 5'-phosphosulfate (PAPS) 3'-phosphatase
MARPSKVSQVMDEYNMEGLGEQLEQMWVVEETHSLRELADLINKQILRKEIDESELEVVEGEVDNYYRLLEDGSVSKGDRVEATRVLERAGIDIASLRDNFVTYQAARTYLNKQRGVQYNAGNAGSGNNQTKIKEQIQKATTKLDTVSSDKISELKEKGEIDIGEYRVSVDITVYCQDCGRPFEFMELLESGQCNCER